MREDYLPGHRVLHTNDLSVARAFAGRLWASHRLDSLGPSPFYATTSHAPLSKTGIVFFRWTPVWLQGEDQAQRYLLVLHESGGSEHQISGHLAHATADQAVLTAPGQPQQFKIDHCRALALHLERAFLDRALDRRFEHWPPLHEWARQFPIDRGPGATLRSLVRWAALEAEQPDSGLLHSPKAVSHLERTLRSLLVDCVTQLYPASAPERDSAGPAYLRLIEEWMEANLEEPVGIEDLAEVAGVGVRAVQAAFRRYRGCRPMAALQSRRLCRARALLLHPLPNTTVTAVALGIGLLHLGRFSMRYRKLFGESPSETLKRGLECQ